MPGFVEYRLIRRKQGNDVVNHDSRQTTPLSCSLLSVKIAPPRKQCLVMYTLGRGRSLTCAMHRHDEEIVSQYIDTP